MISAMEKCGIRAVGHKACHILPEESYYILYLYELFYCVTWANYDTNILTRLLISYAEDWTKKSFSMLGINLAGRKYLHNKSIKIIKAQKHFAKEAGFQGLREHNNNLDSFTSTIKINQC